MVTNIIRLRDGVYVELAGHVFAGPVRATDNGYTIAGAPGLYLQNGTPSSTGQHIVRVLQGQAMICAFIDEMTPMLAGVGRSHYDKQIKAAKEALANLVMADRKNQMDHFVVAALPPTGKYREMVEAMRSPGKVGGLHLVQHVAEPAKAVVDGTIRVAIREEFAAAAEVIAEEFRKVLREEMPAIVADNVNLFDGSEIRLAMTLAPLRG